MNVLATLRDAVVAVVNCPIFRAFQVVAGRARITVTTTGFPRFSGPVTTVTTRWPIKQVPHCADHDFRDDHNRRGAC